MAKKYELDIEIKADSTLDQLTSNLQKVLELKDQLKGDLKIVSDSDIKSISELVSAQQRVISQTDSLKGAIKDKIKVDNEQAKLQEQLIKSSDEEVRGRLRLQQATSEQKKALSLLLKEEQAEEGSRARAIAQNARLRAERDKLNLSTVDGVNKLKQINGQIDVNTKFLTKNNDQAGKQKDNIGNYKDALNGLPGPLGNASRGVQGLGKQFLALLANPIVLLLAAITAALVGLFKAFTSTDEGGTKFAAVMEQVSAVLDVIRQRAALLANSLIKLFTGDFAGAAKDFKDAFTGIEQQLRAAADAAKAYIFALDELEDAEIGYVSQRAINANKIAKLEFLAADRSKSIKQRRDALVEAIKLGEEESKKEAEFANRRFEIELEKQAALNSINKETLRQFIAADDERQKILLANDKELQRVRNNINDEGQKALEESFSKAIEASTKFFEENKKNNAKLAAFEEQLRADREKKRKEEADKRQKELEDQSRLEKELIDARLRNLKEGREKEIAVETEAFRFKIADIKGKSALEAALREELETEKRNRIAAINKKFDDAENAEKLASIERQLSAERQLAITQKEIEILKVGETDKALTEKLEGELLDLKIKAIQEETDIALNNAKLSADERLLIEAEAQKKILELQKKSSKEAVDDSKKRNEEILSTVNLLTDKIIEQEKKKSDAKIAALDRAIAAEEKNRDIQQQRAERGQENTLEFEQENIAKLELAKQEALKKEARRQKVLSYFSLLNGYAKTDAKTALQKTARDIAISEAVTAAFAEKGGVAGEVKETTKIDGSLLSRSHGRGNDILTVMSPKEGILSESRMAKIGGGLGLDKLGKLIDSGYFMNDILFPQVPVFVDSQKGRREDLLISEIQNLQEIVRNKKETSVVVDQYGNVISREVMNGYTKAIKKMRERPRF